MNEQTLNNTLNQYVRDTLSPKQKQRDYISEKYAELRDFLSAHCFQSGSYPRFTAIHPVHDLDVIYVIRDSAVKDNPSRLINGLNEHLQAAYKKSRITNIRRIYAQSHSVTIVFADAPDAFSVDVVPAIELTEMNDFGQPLYLVPEILRMNKYRRERRYEESLSDHPIDWIKSDPRGYIQIGSDLNDRNPNFRHAAKLGKGWRHACKMAYGDDFRLKSFHLELMFSEYFATNPETTTVEALIDCMGAVAQSLDNPQFRDRADNDQFVDEYVRDLTLIERQLILKCQAEAYSIASKLPGAATENELQNMLTDFVTVKKQTSRVVPVASVINSPRQPWGV